MLAVIVLLVSAVFPFSISEHVVKVPLPSLGIYVNVVSLIVLPVLFAGLTSVIFGGSNTSKL